MSPRRTRPIPASSSCRASPAPRTRCQEALLVNPYSKDDISDAIREALDMPKAERVRRWEALIENVRREDVLHWRRAYVEALQGETAPLIAEPLPA